MNLEQLKARAYDLLVQLETTNKYLAETNKAISKLEEESKDKSVKETKEEK